MLTRRPANSRGNFLSGGCPPGPKCLPSCISSLFCPVWVSPWALLFYPQHPGFGLFNLASVSARSRWEISTCSAYFMQRAGCKDSEGAGEHREKGCPRQQDARALTAAGRLDFLPLAIYHPAHHPPDAAKSKRQCRLVSSPALESPVGDSHQEQLAG